MLCKTFILVADPDEGMVVGLTATPGNVSDTVELVSLIDKIQLPNAIEVLADKGYASKSNSAHLSDRYLKARIIKKANRGKALSDE